MNNEEVYDLDWSDDEVTVVCALSDLEKVYDEQADIARDIAKAISNEDNEWITI